jgi:hypothetical protein
MAAVGLGLGVNTGLPGIGEEGMMWKQIIIPPHNKIDEFTAPQHSSSWGLSHKTAYISHRKSLALGGVTSSSRAKTIPPNRLNWAKEETFWDGIEFLCFYKRIFLGKKNWTTPFESLAVHDIGNSSRASNPSPWFSSRERRSTLLVTYLFRRRYSLFVRSKDQIKNFLGFSLLFMFIFALEGRS